MSSANRFSIPFTCLATISNHLRGYNYSKNCFARYKNKIINVLIQEHNTLFLNFITSDIINPFHDNVSFLYPQKTSENL